MKEEKTDIYTRVTNTIITHLENGTRPWVKPWRTSPARMPLRHNGTPYRGINTLMLWGEAIAKGYEAPIWMTFRQANELGANVRKGEKGSLVVYASKITRTEADEASGEENERDIPFLKGYIVFNAEQIEGLPQLFQMPEPQAPNADERNALADQFFSHTGAKLRHGGQRAFYVPGADYIQMPPFETFLDAESYYSTLAHECTHWTGAAHRLNRDSMKGTFGDKRYALEELVAELGAAFVCSILGVTTEVREDHASYIESWLKALKSDKRVIFAAASLAQKATDYLADFSEKSSAP